MTKTVWIEKEKIARIKWLASNAINYYIQLGHFSRNADKWVTTYRIREKQKSKTGSIRRKVRKPCTFPLFQWPQNPPMANTCAPDCRQIQICTDICQLAGGLPKSMLPGPSTLEAFIYMLYLYNVYCILHVGETESKRTTLNIDTIRYLYSTI